MRPRRLKKHREKTADGGRRRLPATADVRAQACRQQTGARVGSHCRRARARLCGRCRRVCGNSPACASAPVRKQPRVRARAFAETAPRARARLCGRCRKFARHRKITWLINFCRNNLFLSYENIYLIILIIKKIINKREKREKYEVTLE